VPVPTVNLENLSESRFKGFFGADNFIHDHRTSVVNNKKYFSSLRAVHI
jgi:hypothetical protein